MLQTDGFSNPQPPKNPFTNLPFTSQQMRSLCSQLKQHNLLTWQLGLFQSLKFCITQFKIDAATILTKYAIKSDIYNYTDNYSLEMLEEYITALIEDCDLHSEYLITKVATLIDEHPQSSFLDFFRRLYVQEKWAELSKTQVRDHIMEQCKQYLTPNNISLAILPNKKVRILQNYSRQFGCFFTDDIQKCNFSSPFFPPQM